MRNYLLLAAVVSPLIQMISAGVIMPELFVKSLISREVVADQCADGKADTFIMNIDSSELNWTPTKAGPLEFCLGTRGFVDLCPTATNMQFRVIGSLLQDDQPFNSFSRLVELSPSNIYHSYWCTPPLTTCQLFELCGAAGCDMTKTRLELTFMWEGIYSVSRSPLDLVLSVRGASVHMPDDAEEGDSAAVDYHGPIAAYLDPKLSCGENKKCVLNSTNLLFQSVDQTAYFNDNYPHEVSTCNKDGSWRPTHFAISTFVFTGGKSCPQLESLRFPPKCSTDIVLMSTNATSNDVVHSSCRSIMTFNDAVVWLLILITTLFPMLSH